MYLSLFSTELHPELQGAIRTTTVWDESQLVTDGRVVTGSWCRMCCSRELSSSSVTPGCTMALYCTHCTTVHSGHLALTWARWLPPFCRHWPPSLPRTSQWRPQHLSISASVRQRLGWLSGKKKPSPLLSETYIWLCGDSLLSNQLCILFSATSAAASMLCV